ncbi:MAG TPA: hypothetical protein VIV06_01395 [Candidatus Limnocylindrales bacterium]
MTVAGLCVSAVLLGAAVVAAFLPAPVRHGSWLPVHLAVAGAASVAIGAVLPFFVAALSATEPAPSGFRVAVVALLAIGALGVTGGIGSGELRLATAGGATFVVGMAGLATLVAVLLRRAVAPRWRPLGVTYLVALAEVLVGATIATLYVAGWPPIVDGWTTLKPAHAWLNLFGFLALVIDTTLVHLLPTTIGARIEPSRLLRLALLALAGGPIVAALGYVAAADSVALAGAATTLAGSVGLAVHLAATWRSRSRWTTDLGWHAFTSGSLGAAIAWQVAGVAIALAGIALHGTAPAGWAFSSFATPLVLGFAVQALLGALTHLLPAIGPGDQARHAEQRRLLGLGARGRFALFNAGTLLLAIGLPSELGPLTALGAVLAASSASGSIALVARAVVRADQAAQPLRKTGEVRR